MNQQNDVILAGFGIRLVAWLLDAILFWLTLIIGYIIWWLIVIGRGQTPGKQIVGIKVIKTTGEPSNWGYTFVREFLVKGLLVGIISAITFYIFGLIDNLWALWDDENQTLHDKIMSTWVVQDNR